MGKQESKEYEFRLRVTYSQKVVVTAHSPEEAEEKLNDMEWESDGPGEMIDWCKR